MDLRRWALYSLIALAVALAITVPLDYSRYPEELRSHGLSGLLRLPSLLAFQLVFVISAVVLLAAVAQQRPEQKFQNMVLLLATAACLYLLSLWLLHGFSSIGMFGWAPAGLCLSVLFFPIGGLLLVGVPVTILYALRRPRA